MTVTTSEHTVSVGFARDNNFTERMVRKSYAPAKVTFQSLEGHTTLAARSALISHGFDLSKWWHVHPKNANQP